MVEQAAEPSAREFRLLRAYTRDSPEIAGIVEGRPGTLVLVLEPTNIMDSVRLMMDAQAHNAAEGALLRIEVRRAISGGSDDE